MRKIFISQPMANKSKTTILNEHNNIVEKLKESLNDDFEIVNSLLLNLPESASPIYYLAESIRKLDNADTVYFAKGWHLSRGCIVEYVVAQLYGKIIIKE